MEPTELVPLLPLRGVVFVAGLRGADATAECEFCFCAIAEGLGVGQDGAMGGICGREFTLVGVEVDGPGAEAGVEQGAFEAGFCEGDFVVAVCAREVEGEFFLQDVVVVGVYP